MHKNSGFSLLELLTVVAIVAVLSSIAVPGMLQWLPKQRVGGAAREVKSTLEFARANAIRNNAAVTVEFDWINDSLAVLDDDGVTLRTRQMPEDVDLQSNGLATPVTFNGHGFSIGNFGEVALVNESNNTLRRTVNLTPGGNSRIQ